MKLSGLVVAAEFLDDTEAQISAATLRAENIAAHISHDPRHPMMGRSLIGPGTRGTDPVISLLVLESQLDHARAVLAAEVLADSGNCPLAAISGCPLTATLARFVIGIALAAERRRVAQRPLGGIW